MIASRVKTKDGYEDIIAYKSREVRLPVLNFIKIRRGKKNYKFASTFMVLDTETSHVDETAGWVYQWAIKLKGVYLYGRTPSELVETLRDICENYHLNDERKIVLYIHNASYDIQYLKHFFKRFDPFLKIMTTDTHAVLYVDMFGFKIYCSYRMTGLSLAKLSEVYATTYVKAVGEIDYNIVRYQDSELGANDWEYMFSDVASQYDGIQGYLRAMGYDYAIKAPMTSTGFVREDCREASRTDKAWRKEFQKGKLELQQYNLLRWAFMGGVCIANFMYAGETVRECERFKIGHTDFRSSYPAQQMINYFPEGAPTWYGTVESMAEFKDLLDTYCCIFQLTMEDVHINAGVTAPCIPSSKCIGLVDPVRMNGKIVYARRLTIAVTEIDFKWISEQYHADGGIKVSNMLIFNRGKMPEWLKGEIMKYFEGKCTLKNTDPVLYMRSKACLNSIYGMTATALVREEYETDDDLVYHPKKYFEDGTDEEVQDSIMLDVNQKQLDKYYRSYNSFLPYQYSLYTTSWARNALYEMITAIGYDNFLYCDTDSAFYISTPEVEERLEKYRMDCIERAKAAGAYIGDQYLGEPTKEPPIRAFRALHAKCYAMEEFNKKTGDYQLQVVVAGIPKKTQKWIDGVPIVKTNAEELESIDNLADGFIFSHNGGTRCVYIEQKPEMVDINGHMTELASAAIISNIEKVIGENMWTEENGFLMKINEKQVNE